MRIIFDLDFCMTGIINDSQNDRKEYSYFQGIRDIQIA